MVVDCDRIDGNGPCCSYHGHTGPLYFVMVRRVADGGKILPHKKKGGEERGGLFASGGLVGAAAWRCHGGIRRL